MSDMGAWQNRDGSFVVRVNGCEALLADKEELIKLIDHLSDVLRGMPESVSEGYKGINKYHDDLSKKAIDLIAQLGLVGLEKKVAEIKRRI